MIILSDSKDTLLVHWIIHTTWTHCGPCITGWLGSWVGMELAFLVVSQSSKKLCLVPKFWMVWMKSLKWLYSDDQATQRQQSLPQIHCAHIWMHSLSSLNSSELKVIQSCSTLCDPMTKQSMEFSGQKTGVGSLSLLQGIVPTQGSNPGLPHCRQILYQLSHQGNPLWAEIELK